MGIGAAILGASAIGAVGSAVAGHEASSAATNSANTAAQTQLSMFNQTRQTLAPFFNPGAQAFGNLAQMFGFGPPNADGSTGLQAPDMMKLYAGLQQTPGYQFGLDQGVRALDNSAAARGMTLSGAQMHNVVRYGEDYAAQNMWQPYVSNLQWAANLGENAAAGTGQLGASAASGAANAQLQGGMAAGSAIGNATAGVANTLSSGLTQYAMNNNNPWGGYNMTGPTQPMSAYTGAVGYQDPWGIGSGGP